MCGLFHGSVVDLRAYGNWIIICFQQPATDYWESSRTITQKKVFLSWDKKERKAKVLTAIKRASDSFTKHFPLQPSTSDTTTKMTVDFNNYFWVSLTNFFGHHKFYPSHARPRNQLHYQIVFRSSSSSAAGDKMSEFTTSPWFTYAHNWFAVSETEMSSCSKNSLQYRMAW